MAWNGSDQTSSGAPRSRGRISAKCAKGAAKDSRQKTEDRGGDKRQKTKDARPSPSALRPSLFALLLLALAGAAVWYFLRPAPPPKSNNPTIQQSNNRQIAPHTPAPARTNKVAKAEKPKPVDPREDYDHNLCERDANGILRYKGSHCRAFDPSRKRTAVVNAARREVQIFSNRCERAIASLLQFNPNGAMFRSPDYTDPAFEQSFMDALVTPIQINPDDNAYERDLKQAVIDAKKEISRRIREGETLAGILGEAKKELERLGAYKQSLTGEIKTMMKDGNLTTSEVRDLVSAANQMFEKEGLNPIDADDFVAWNLRLTAERNGEDPNAAVEAFEAEREQKALEKETQKKQGEQK